MYSAVLQVFFQSDFTNSPFILTAFAFFADPNMQSFYRRFVRDYMRYKDEIQCNGHTLVQAVRREALSIAPEFHGEYYALHIRRGDFQFKVRLLLHEPKAL